MMPPKVEAALARRLEALTGEDAACCVEDYRAQVRRLQAAPAFAQTLARAQAMADEARLAALSFLKRRDEACACQVQAALGLSHATVSHHMARLEAAGLVEVERRGKWAYYRLTEAARGLVP